MDILCKNTYTNPKEETLRKKQTGGKGNQEKRHKATFSDVLFLSCMEVLILLKGAMIPRTTGSLPIQTLLPIKQPPTPKQSFASSWAGRGGGGWRGVDESLNRPEEGHTGAMAIPKTTYLLSHNDSACQNNCQDT